MTREQFARALYQGMGRMIAHARAHGAAQFADEILRACLYNPIYDRQAGGSRAIYLRELIAATGEEPRYRAHILAALANPDDEMDEEQLFDLALRFAQEGDDAARRAMRARFLDNVSSGETAGDSQIAELDGDLGLRFVIEQIGAAMGRAVDFSESWISERMLDDLEAAFADDPSVLDDWRVAAFRAAARGPADERAAREEAQRQRQRLRDTLATLSYAEVQAAERANMLALTWLSRWGEQASEPELRRAADDLLATTDPERLRRILFIFARRDFPDGHGPLMPLLDSPEERIPFRAARAIARFRHPDLRARAIALLARPDSFELGLILLVGNHAPGDYAMLAALARGQMDDERLHALLWRSHELFERDPAPEAADLLLTLYERGPCDLCREEVVADLIAIGALPPHIAEECRLDANEGVRELVAHVSG